MPKPKPPAPEKSAREDQKTQFQRFDYQEILRSRINPAPYNPRKISDYGKGLLRKKIQEVGCVEPLVWNERTGNLVGGHQRLGILDEMERDAGRPMVNGVPEYYVGVSVVRMTSKQEKALNIFLNNSAAQGYFDKDSFFAMLPELELADIGFTLADLDAEFGGLPAGFEAASQAAKEEKTVEEINRSIEAIKKFRANTAEHYAKNDPDNDADYFLILAFPSCADKERFLLKINEPHDRRMINAAELRAWLTPGLLE